ncbi:coenzyme F420-0:L-glutamate ligase [uncultured Anaerotruncus sp.]|uniref:coenzyme F420-0:L-glutamate ligase n=1 Tax=uncultured Anaerotruncus sp. TaxID=905011 RepID=UPI00280AC083|nr:coenzyme F420-0:L-glutamate ligase [uncultured Anaerotruncus sp.]
MSRMIGTTVRGVRAPIIRPGDDLAQIVTDSVLEAAASEGFSFHDRDVVGVTEAVVAKAQGNYASTDDIAADVRSKFGDHPIGVIFPILSRNRFAICLRGIARGAKKIVLMFSYPSDEVGNTLVSEEKLEAAGVNPWTDVLDEKRYRALFGENKHLFTGVDYVEYYASLIREEGADVEILFANRPSAVLEHTKHVLCCDIHTRERTKRLLRAAGAETVYGLDDILSAPINGSGYNADYGLLGSNKSTESRVKLFPRDCAAFARDLQHKLSEATGRQIEALVYGDGAFRDPVGKIWELADPVVSPGFTEGLNGLPNEVKLKYLADNQFRDLSGNELRQAVSEYIHNKKADLKGTMETQGTTPRRLTDLIGSLCDLTSGSGDKGTPIVLIQGYFDNFAD